MLLEINEQTVARIRNRAFRKYAEIYNIISRQFIEQLQQTEMTAAENRRTDLSEKILYVQARGATVENDGKSIHNNWLSDACRACRTGEGSVSFFLSLQCHRHCYYCFNPNQESYERHTFQMRDCVEELRQMSRSGYQASHIALTGGEPLLHPRETIEFFQCANELFRSLHTRLYTSGDLLDETTLAELHKASLSEIRFSIKMEDPVEMREVVIDRIELARRYIPAVMVEMPVIPGNLPEMKELLLRLDRLGIAGINLLEFCFPFHNAAEFRKWGFRIKNPPYRVLYDYWYAGGLPVADSEADCLKLLEFAMDEGLKMGVHYCSLENKHTGQVFQQNSRQAVPALAYFSPRDYFLKTAKVFGDDIGTVLDVFADQGVALHQFNAEYQFLEFHVREIHCLKELNLEIGISSQIMEERKGGHFLRELKIDRVMSSEFDIQWI